MYILGISAYYHDAAAALLHDGKLIAAAQEERFSRRKHDPALPMNAIRFCLETAGIRPQDLESVVFYEKPLRKFERLLTTQMQTFPRSVRQFPRAMSSWLASKLWIRTTLAKSLQIPVRRILFTDHHQSHAASAFLCAPFEEAAVLVMDGVGEWATTTIYQGRTQPSCTLEPRAELHFPHSIGLLYSTFTAFLGFEVNEGEYKVMGMAPYGEPRYVDKVEQLLERHANGGFGLKLEYFSFHYDPDKSFSPRFVDLFGAPREGHRRFITARTGQPGDEPEADARELEYNQHYADIAASIQVVTEGLMLDMAREAHRLTGSANLCLAGGVALNSVANGRIVREGPFQNVFIQPAAGDAGGALGAALYAWQVGLGHGRGFVFDRADWGQAIDEQKVARFVRDCRLEAQEMPDDQALLARVAELLAGGQIIGWAQGRFEWGPRALGHRSILADPRDPAVKDRVNRLVKFREPFRPFAPAVLAEAANTYFQLDRDGGLGDPARFMLLTAQVRDAHREHIPATTHVDGSARVQKVESASNPRFYGLLEQLGGITGLPVLLNTSFNLKGEPIVNTPLEAFATFKRSGLDALILDRWIIEAGR